MSILVNDKCRVTQHFLYIQLYFIYLGIKKKSLFLSRANLMHWFFTLVEKNDFGSRWKDNLRIFLFVIQCVLLYVLKCFECISYKFQMSHSYPLDIVKILKIGILCNVFLLNVLWPNFDRNQIACLRFKKN